MMKSMRHSSSNVPLRPGVNSLYLFDDRTGDAVLSEAIRKLDATVIDFTSEEER